MTSTSPADARAVIVPGDLGRPSGGSRYGARVVDELRATGVAFDLEPLAGAWPAPSPADLDALRAALSRHRDVLIDGLIASAAPDEIARARDAGVRVAVLLHLPLPADGAGVAAAAAERRTLEVADLVVATSAWARDDLADRYGLAGVHVVAPGTDAAPVATGSAPPHLLFLGSLTERKNVRTLIEALAGLGDRAWTCAIVGPDGADASAADAVRGAAASTSRIEVTGPLGGEALERMWDRTDLLVLPSHVETYGMVVTEALARGIPALVASGTGAVEALRGRDERRGLPAPGMTADPTSTGEWAARIVAFLDDHDLRAALRAAALRHRDRLPTWRQTARELRTVLGW